MLPARASGKIQREICTGSNSELQRALLQLPATRAAGRGLCHAASPLENKHRGIGACTRTPFKYETPLKSSHTNVSTIKQRFINEPSLPQILAPCTSPESYLLKFTVWNKIFTTVSISQPSQRWEKLIAPGLPDASATRCTADVRHWSSHREPPSQGHAESSHCLSQDVLPAEKQHLHEISRYIYPSLKNELLVGLMQEETT